MVKIGIDDGRRSGTGVWEEMKLHGPVINMNFFWEDLIVTAEPQDIKVRCTVCRVSFPCINESLQDYFGH